MPIVVPGAYSEQELADAAREMEAFPGGICERLEATIAQRSVSASAWRRHSQQVAKSLAALLLLDSRGYLLGTEAHRFFEYVVQQAYATDREVQEATVRWLVRIQSEHTSHVPETLQAIKNSLSSIAEKQPGKYPASFGEAIVDITLALSFWLLSGEENATATIAYWRGLKTVFKIQSSQSLNPLLEAFEILEPQYWFPIITAICATNGDKC